MRKNIIYYVLLTGISALCSLTSCSGDDEQVYSCDKQVNTWVKANASSLQTMTREQWKGLSERVNIPVYRAFSPEQKYTFWKEKISELRTLPWSAKELEHIMRLDTFLNNNKSLFSNEKMSDEEKDDLDVFSYKWIDYAEKELGWSKELIYAIVATGSEVKDTKGTLRTRKRSSKAIAKLTPLAESNTSQSECHCNTESLVSRFLTGFYCEYAKCETTNDGCGFLTLYKCDGTCGGF